MGVDPLHGYRDSLGNPSSEFPARSLAVALLDALSDPTVYSWSVIEERLGIPEAYLTAERSFMAYGFPDLSPNALAEWTTEASFRRPENAPTRQPAQHPPVKAPDHRYGFNRPTHDATSPTPPQQETSE